MPFESAEREWTAEERRRWTWNDRHGKLLAGRFNRLVEKCYRPVFRTFDEWFDFEHPHPSAIQVQLWPDGQVVDRYPTRIRDGERTIIAADDDRLFESFLSSVPSPRLRDRMLNTRIGDAAMTVWAYVILIGFVWTCSTLAEITWKFLTERQ